MKRREAGAVPPLFSSLRFHGDDGRRRVRERSADGVRIGQRIDDDTLRNLRCLDKRYIVIIQPAAGRDLLHRVPSDNNDMENGRKFPPIFDYLVHSYRFLDFFS